MSDLDSAARRLRDSVAALRSIQQAPWLAGTGHVYTADRGWWLASGLGTELAKLIATTSSPPTVLLEASLLAAIERVRHHLGTPADLAGAYIAEIYEAADALASAILHTDQQGDDSGSSSR